MPQRKFQMLGQSRRLPGDERVIELRNEQDELVTVERGHYRDAMLLPSIEAARKDGDADRLAGLLDTALRDDFAADVLDAAHFLTTIDPLAERSCCTYAKALDLAGHPQRAADVLEVFEATHPPSSFVAGLRATIAEALGDRQGALHWATVMIQRDPNHPGGHVVLWRHATNAGGEEHGRAMFRWAAEVGNAHAARQVAKWTLEAQGPEASMPMYERTVAGGDPEVITQVIADLAGVAKRPDLALQLVVPIFDPVTHGEHTAVNVIRAFAESRRVDEGEAMLARCVAAGILHPKHVANFRTWFADIRAGRA